MAGLGLSVGTEAVGGLRYQLFHRTYAALAHARAVKATRAVLVVHSFADGADRDNQADFRRFLAAMGADGEGMGTAARIGVRSGVNLSAVWISDRPLP